MKRLHLRRYLAFLLLIASIYSEVFTQEGSPEDTTILNEKIFNYSTKGYNNIRFNINLDTAEYYLLKAIDLQYTSSYYEIDYRVANNHVLLASVYRTIYNNSEALKHLDEAESILKKSNPDHQLFASLYHNKGNIFKVKHDFYQTKEYYEYLDRLFLYLHTKHLILIYHYQLNDLR